MAVEHQHASIFIVHQATQITPPFFPCPYSSLTYLWPSFWSQLHTCNVSWLHLSWLRHYCADNNYLQTNRHLRKYSNVFCAGQHVSSGPHFSKMTDTQTYNQKTESSLSRLVTKQSLANVSVHQEVRALAFWCAGSFIPFDTVNVLSQCIHRMFHQLQHQASVIHTQVSLSHFPADF